MQPEFAPIQSSDIEPLFGLCKALIDQYEDTARIDYPAVLGWTRRKLERQISEYRRILWDGQHVGYLHFAPSQGQIELDDFYIFPEFQHRGIGSAVLRLLREETELAVYSTEPRALVFSTALLTPKTTRTTQGVQVMTLKPKYHVASVCPLEDSPITNLARYRCRAVPAAGAIVREEDGEEKQMQIL